MLTKNFEKVNYTEERCTPDMFNIKNIIGTINKAYHDGVSDCDEKYREAILVACKKVGINFSPFFNIVLHEITKSEEQ